MKNMNRKRVIVAVLVASVAVLVGAWALLDRQDDAVGGPEVGQESATEHWEKLANRGLAELRARPAGQRWPYSHLRGDGQEMPRRMREEVSESLEGSGPLKLRFDHSQYAVTPAGVGLWIVRGKGVTCMFQDKTGAASCATTAQVERRGLFLEVYRAGPPPGAKPTHFVALGIAPDWAQSVRATIGRGSRVIPIVDNLYSQRAETPIRIQPPTR